MKKNAEKLTLNEHLRETPSPQKKKQKPVPNAARTEKRSQKRHVHSFFAKMAVLNEIIAKGGEEAKDAINAKARLAVQFDRELDKKTSAKKSQYKNKEMLDSYARLSGSYESGKRR